MKILNRRIKLNFFSQLSAQVNSHSSSQRIIIFTTTHPLSTLNLSQFSRCMKWFDLSIWFVKRKLVRIVKWRRIGTEKKKQSNFLNFFNVNILRSYQVMPAKEKYKIVSSKYFSFNLPSWLLLSFRCFKQFENNLHTCEINFSYLIQYFCCFFHARLHGYL